MSAKPVIRKPQIATLICRANRHRPHAQTDRRELGCGPTAITHWRRDDPTFGHTPLAALQQMRRRQKPGTHLAAILRASGFAQLVHAQPFGYRKRHHRSTHQSTSWDRIAKLPPTSM